MASPFKEPARSDLMGFKALELPHSPGHERLIDVSKHRIQRRWCESPIVRDPPPKERIEQLGDVVQRSLLLPISTTGNGSLETIKGNLPPENDADVRGLSSVAYLSSSFHP